jgi:1A family penicillin-binding protein
MKIETFIKRQAKLYPKRSFETRLVLGFLFFVFLLAVKIGDSIIRLLQAFYSRLHRLSTFVFRGIQKGQDFVQQVPTYLRRSLRFLFPVLHQKPGRAKKPKIHQRKEPQAQYRSRKTVPQLLAIPFTQKLKYALFGAVLSLLLIFLPILMLIFIQDLPSPRELSLRQIPQTTKIFDRNGILLSEIYASQNRTLITLNDVPKHLQQATLAIEDKNFYKHPGFDIASIIRALKENFIEGKRIQGGSTLTQQLIKSSMLTSEKSISRKIKEIALAFWAERIYTKDQIFEMYFNQVPYGGTAWGIEAASEVYFDKHVSKLSLAESTFLAGITAAPSAYSPYGSQPTLWKNRQAEVLNRMVSLGYITKEQAIAAHKQELHFNRPQAALHAPHFVAYIKEILVKKYGLAMVEKGGLQVTTTLDLKTQQMAEKIVREEVANATYLNLTNGAAVITDPKNGDIIAMVGSKNFNDPDGGKVNIATSLRQPGSTVKVITYAAALAKGVTAATILEDTPTSFPSVNAPPYIPVNYDGRYYGRVPVRFALANSLNLPAVKLLNQIGVDTMVNLGRDMGIENWETSKDYGLAVTLGGTEVTMLDMATVNGTLANQGIRVDLHPILRITDYKNNIIEQKTETEGYRVLPKGVAFIVSDILSDNIARSSAFGPNSPLVITNHKVSVKTGTSDNKRDNWTIGYTNNYVVTVWVGNNDNSPMSQSLASGITGAAPIWHRIMSQLLEKQTETTPTPPTDVIAVNCFGRTEYFLKGTEQNLRCTIPVAPGSTNTNAVVNSGGNFQPGVPTSTPQDRRGRKPKRN